MKNSWKCCGFGLFSCWQLWFHEKNCQNNFGWKTRENVGDLHFLVVDNIDFPRKLQIFVKIEFLDKSLTFRIVCRYKKKSSLASIRNTFQFWLHTYEFPKLVTTLRLTLIRVSAHKALQAAMLQLDGGRIQFGSSLVVGSPPQAQDHRKYQRKKKSSSKSAWSIQVSKSNKGKKQRKSSKIS